MVTIENILAKQRSKYKIKFISNISLSQLEAPPQSTDTSFIIVQADLVFFLKNLQAMQRVSAQT